MVVKRVKASVVKRVKERVVKRLKRVVQGKSIGLKEVLRKNKTLKEQLMCLTREKKTQKY
jgi:hypothetical protein